MSELNYWLQQATRRLSHDAAARVKTEIRQHWESARQDAIDNGKPDDQADREALASLGDPKTANRQYRKVLFTKEEARMLRDANWESRALQCMHSRPWLGLVLRALPLTALAAAAMMFALGDSGLGCILLAAALYFGVFLIGPALPVYNPSRSRVFRYAKLASVAVSFALAFGPHVWQWFWLICCCIFPIFWSEWVRASIRRKLPVAQWPRQLYL